MTWDLFSAISAKTQSNKNQEYFNLVLENNHKMFCVEEKAIIYLFPKENNLAYFGLWETIDDISVNKELFKQMFTWAKSQQIKKIIGPIDGNLYFKSHLCQIRKSPIFNLETDNPSYMMAILSQVCSNSIINTKDSALITFPKVKINSNYKCIPFDSKYFTGEALSNLWGGYLFSNFSKSDKDIQRCLKYIDIYKDELYSIMVVENNILLGYCIVNIKGKFIGGKILAVHQDYRGKGIGSVLINHIVEKFPDYNIYGLQVNTTNKKVTQLCQKFAKINYTKKYFLYKINSLKM